VTRLSNTFARLKKEGRAAFVPFITAGDPDMDTSFAILEKLPAAGADVIELGLPFTDPMADGPAVQAASVRALAAGCTTAKVLKLIEKFRKADKTTPIVLMGYYNNVHAYGTARFVKDVAHCGVDGLIIVDLPMEEDEVLRVPAKAQGVDLIRFVTRQRLSLLCLGRRRDRDQVCARRGSARCHHAHPGRYRSALHRGLWHPHARTGCGHRQHCRRGGGGLGHCQPRRRQYRAW
jgi:hypothetical protein